MQTHPFTLRQLQYLVCVADLGGFRRAAQACHVAQPSLSAQVAQVEALLGVIVFERGGGHVTVTRAGEAIVAHARRVLVNADDLVHVARRAQDPLDGALRLGIIPTVSPYLLPELVPALRHALPRLQPQWREEKTAVCLEGLRQGHLDAAVLAQQSDLHAFTFVTLGQDPFVLAAAPDHALAQRKGPVTLPELDGATLLLLDEGHCFRDQALEVCAARDTHEADFRATSLATLTQMVASGAGVTLLPRLALAVENRGGALRTRPFLVPGPHRTITLVWRTQSPLGEALTRVGEVMRGACARVLSRD